MIYYNVLLFANLKSVRENNTIFKISIITLKWICLIVLKNNEKTHLKLGLCDILLYLYFYLNHPSIYSFAYSIS